MKRLTSSLLRTKALMVVVLFATAILTFSSQNASASGTAGCYIMYGSSTLYLFEDNFEGCAMTIQASGYTAEFSYGYWGNYLVAVDNQGNAYYQDTYGQWQYYGVVQTGLAARCQRGDRQACETHTRQLDNAIQQYNWLYP